ncbi:MAG: hypothetical protein RTV41_04275 [Candidatus Thorarchaeota archaeon]
MKGDCSVVWIGLIFTIVAVAAFIVGLYWMNSSSKGRGHYSQKDGHETRKQVLQKHEQMKERARNEDARRRMRGWRRR